LSPSPASVGSDDLTCSIDIESTDDDGDAILYTYQWTDPNGSVQQTTTEVPDTSDIFLAAGTTEGTWTCEVTPHDGIDDGASSTASVLVGSTCSSLYFDQASNLEVMDSSGLALNEVSISLWIQPYDTDYGSWVSKKGRGYGGHHAYHILQDNGAFRVRFQIANCYPCDDAIHLIDIRGGSITPYRWHHVAATYDASTGLGSLYVDGVLVASEVKGSGLAYYTTTEPLNIGSEHYTNVYDGYTFGLANNVQIFDAPLSSTDIAALAQNNSIQSSASLVYTTTNTSTDIIDQSGNGFDGWVSGVTDTETCPEEDLDGDGTSAWEDCDDNNPAVTTGPSGGGAYCPGIDCEQILDDGYSNGDGTYWIDPLGSGAFEVHCDMTTDGGGWTRVVQGDYATDNCPNGWTRSSGLTTVCTRETSSSNDLIRSTAIDVFGITYDEVRGYLEGYQFGSNDGFGDNPPNDINDTYGDVVSFTNSPTGNREHLFSYVVGFGKTNNDDSNCPGVNGGANPPSFVGSDYYCETANLSASGPSSQWYTNPLYQGYWFQVASTPTDVDIEARIMGTHVSSNEDIGVGKMELYIR
ncbi:MAG: LamG-like jellyroll fold domain-containing protein, partial [Myxococcota bacterium]|nr:LamG-like jellyroll fold domain-containing protein [Myxococcota bacterium]